MSNPLLSSFDTPYEMPPFSRISSKHYEEGIESALTEAKNEVEAIIGNDASPSFANTIEALENSGEKLQRNASILFNLNSAYSMNGI